MICIISMLIYGVVVPFSIYLDNIKFGHNASPDKAFGGYVIPVCVLTAFMCCVLFCEEYDIGTLRNKIVIGHSRKNIYLAGLFICIIAGEMMCIAFLVPSTLHELILLGEFKNSLTVLTMYFVSVSLCVSACISLYCMLMLTMQKRISGTVLTLFVMLVIIYIGLIVEQSLKLPPQTYQYHYVNGTITESFGENPNYPKGLYRTFLEYLYDFLPSDQAWQFNTMTADNLPRMAISSCVTIIFTVLWGIRIFEKKDLK